MKLFEKMIKSRNRKGFGLMDCIIALGIIAIITTSTLTAFVTAYQVSNWQNAEYRFEIIENNILACYKYANTVNEFHDALKNIRADNGSVGDTLDDKVGDYIKQSYISITGFGDEEETGGDVTYVDYDPTLKMTNHYYDYIIADYANKTVTFYDDFSAILTLQYSSSTALENDVKRLTENSGKNKDYTSSGRGYLYTVKYTYKNNETVYVTYLPNGNIWWDHDGKCEEIQMQEFEKLLYNKKVYLSYFDMGYERLGVAGVAAIINNHFVFNIFSAETGEQTKSDIISAGDNYKSARIIINGEGQSTDIKLSKDSDKRGEMSTDWQTKRQGINLPIFQDFYKKRQSDTESVSSKYTLVANTDKDNTKNTCTYYSDVQVFKLNGEEYICYAQKSGDGFKLYRPSDGEESKQKLIYSYTDTANLTSNFERVKNGSLSFNYNNPDKENYKDIWYDGVSNGYPEYVQFDYNNLQINFNDKNDNNVISFSYNNNQNMFDKSVGTIVGMKASGGDALASGKYSDYYSFNIDYDSTASVTKSKTDSDWATFIKKYNIDSSVTTVSGSETIPIKLKHNGSVNSTFDVLYRKYLKKNTSTVTWNLVRIAPKVKITYTLNLKSVTITKRTINTAYDGGNVSYNEVLDYTLNYELSIVNKEYIFDITELPATDHKAKAYSSDVKGDPHDLSYSAIYHQESYYDINESALNYDNYHKSKSTFSSSDTSSRRAAAIERIKAQFIKAINGETSESAFLVKYASGDRLVNYTDSDAYKNIQTKTAISKAGVSFGIGSGKTAEVESKLKSYISDGSAWLSSPVYIIRNGVRQENAAFLSSERQKIQVLLRKYTSTSTQGEHEEVIQNNDTIFYAPKDTNNEDAGTSNFQWSVQASEKEPTEIEEIVYKYIYKDDQDYACYIEAKFSNVTIKAKTDNDDVYEGPFITIIPFGMYEVESISKSSYAKESDYIAAVGDFLKSDNNRYNPITYRKG